MVSVSVPCIMAIYIFLLVIVLPAYFSPPLSGAGLVAGNNGAQMFRALRQGKEEG